MREFHFLCKCGLRRTARVDACCVFSHDKRRYSLGPDGSVHPSQSKKPNQFSNGDLDRTIDGICHCASGGTFLHDAFRIAFDDLKGFVEHDLLMEQTRTTAKGKWFHQSELDHTYQLFVLTGGEDTGSPGTHVAQVRE